MSDDLKFNREEYAEWLDNREHVIERSIEGGMEILEEHGPEAVYMLILDGGALARAQQMAEAIGLKDVTLLIAQQGLSVYIDTLMKAYEAKHGPVDWLAAFERRHDRAVAELKKKRAAKARAGKFSAN